MDRLSKQEFFIGVLGTIPLIFKLGAYTPWLAVFCGVLWMLGGTYNKLIRRLGVPVSVFLYSCLVLPPSYWYALCVPMGYGVLCIGDGFPDNRPTTRDEGSFLGRLVERFISDEDGGGILTKILIPLILQLAWIPIYLAS